MNDSTSLSGSQSRPSNFSNLTPQSGNAIPNIDRRHIASLPGLSVRELNKLSYVEARRFEDTGSLSALHNAVSAAEGAIVGARPTDIS